MSEKHTRVVELTKELLYAYQNRIRSTDYKAYTVKDSHHVHFVKVALAFEDDTDFDSELFITTAFGMEWFIKGKKLKRPLPFQLPNKKLYQAYKALKNSGVKEGRKEERIEKAIRDSIVTLKRLSGRKNAITTLSLEHILEALRGGLISVYLVAIWPLLGRRLERRVMEAILDGDPIAGDTWGVLSKEVGEAELTMKYLGIIGQMYSILKEEGVLD